MAVRAVAGLIGTLVTLGAVALVLAPDTVLAVVPVDAVVASDPRVTLVAVAGLLGLVSVAVARSRGGADTPPMVDHSLESVDAAAGPAPGQSVTYRVERAADGDDGADASVRETLSASAVRALARDPAVETEAAEDALRSGEWTDDPLAAAYLGDPTMPLSSRLREWLAPERERRRRIERTVAAIEAAGEASGS
jgi:hypothetical protein